MEGISNIEQGISNDEGLKVRLRADMRGQGCGFVAVEERGMFLH